MMIEQPEFCTIEKYGKMMETYQPVYPLTAGLSNKTIQKAIESDRVTPEHKKELVGYRLK